MYVYLMIYISTSKIRAVAGILRRQWSDCRRTGIRCTMHNNNNNTTTTTTTTTNNNNNNNQNNSNDNNNRG